MLTTATRRRLVLSLMFTGVATAGVLTTAQRDRGHVDMNELWAAPTVARNLFYGVGGPELAPGPRELFTVIAVKTTGFSEGYTVADSQKREWSAKLPPEASTEVVASRILWGLGYHQPPIYYLPEWQAAGAKAPNPQPAARFREKDPRGFHGLKEDGIWAYDHNPFVTSRPLQGLIVLQVMLGNSDLKPEQNVRYSLREPVEGARRWYVARDLGQTFGRTGVIKAPRGDIDVFEHTRFIRRVAGGKVEFEYQGRHVQLLDTIHVEDLEWICRRLEILTDQQWTDAFRAGGIEGDLARRFIQQIKARIAEGLTYALRERRPS